MPIGRKATNKSDFLPCFFPLQKSRKSELGVGGEHIDSLFGAVLKSYILNYYGMAVILKLQFSGSAIL